MKTTLFLPVRNEVEGSRVILPRIDRSWIDEILVVDAQSTDGTKQFYEQNNVKVVDQTDQGKGVCGAYWDGVDHAKGDVIIAFSPDNNSIPELIPKVVAKMQEGYDMVIVSRYKDQARSEDDDRVTAFGNWMFTKIVNFFFGANYTDTLVMFRAFRKDLVQRLDLDEKNIPVFEMQLAIRCAKAECRVAEIPGDEPKRIGGVRKMRPIYNGLTIVYIILKELLVFHPKRFRRSVSVPTV